MGKSVSVSWRPLVTDDVEAQHIRCHELQDTNELSVLEAKLKGQHVKALILINTQDNYFVTSKILEGKRYIVL